MNCLKNIYLLAICLCLVFLSGCKKEVFTPHVKGNLVGKLLTYDSYGTINSNHSGVSVKLQGNYVVEAKTDYYGQFEFKDIPTGNYMIIAEKKGYGTLKVYNVQHLGGSTTTLTKTHGILLMLKKSCDKIHSFNIENDKIIADLELSTLSPPDNIFMRILYSTNPEFTQETAMWANTFTVKLDYSGKFIGSWNYEDLDLPVGNTIYYKAGLFFYPAFNYDYTSTIFTYQDIVTHQIIYPNLSDESAVNTITLQN